MKLRLLILILTSFLISLLNIIDISAKGKYFIVTAYYSPLPGQTKYHTGNYYSEIRLNGKGTHGASGKAVFPGMIAAPKSYEFGTKIYFEGFGVGEVADRGGAIVNAGSVHKYDRIDIWMGYGDSGLYRAEQWGIRTIYGEVVDDGFDVSIKFSSKGLLENGESGELIEKTIFDERLSPKDEGDNIRELQVILNRVGYTTDVTGIYDEDTVESIVNLQIDQGIIDDLSSYGAGYFGSKTSESLEEKFQEFQNSFNHNELNTDLSDINSEKSSSNLNLEISENNDIINSDIDNKIISNNINTTETLEDIDSNEIIDNNLKETISDSSENGDYKVSEIKIESEAQANITYNNPKSINTPEENLVIWIDGLISPSVGDKGKDIEYIQNILKVFGHYNYKITGYFGDITKASLIEYQIDKKIINNEYSYGAGYLGNKTKNQIKEDLISNIK